MPCSWAVSTFIRCVSKDSNKNYLHLKKFLRDIKRFFILSKENFWFDQAFYTISREILLFNSGPRFSQSQTRMAKQATLRGSSPDSWRMAGVQKGTRSLKKTFYCSSTRKQKPRDTFKYFLETRQVYFCNVRCFLAVFLEFRAKIFVLKFACCFETKHCFLYFFFEVKV